MGQSFHRVSSLEGKSTDSLGDFQAHNHLYNPESDRSYTMLARDGKLAESRYQLDFDGSQTNRMEITIDYVIGSGRHARTFLHRTAEGKLVELPVSWYSERGGYWEMSPGYDNVHQADFRKEIDYGCISCHNAYPAQDQIIAKATDRNLFGDTLPNGIDCQRCHGPGRAHIRTVLSGATIAEVEKSIVNPARLPRDRQMEVCMQCHLETTSWPLPHSLHPTGWKPFSYQPGTPLANHQIYFDRVPGKQEHFEVAHQAYQLRRSACFRNSTMTCLTCHNPHVESHGADETKRYVAICKTCHTNVHQGGISGEAKLRKTEAAPNCLTCHMWKQRTDDAVHVVMTNHDIQRLRPPGDPTRPKHEIEEVYRGEVLPYYPESLSGIPDGEIYAALAQMEDNSNLMEGTQRLERLLREGSSNQPEFYFALGAADSKLGKYAEAIFWYKEALKRKPEDERVLRAMGASYEAMGDFARAAEMEEHAAALYPADTILMTNLGRAYLDAGRTEDARRIFQTALGKNASLPETNLLLGLTEVRAGNNGAAETAFRSTINAQPDSAEAHNDLASLLAAKQQFGEAEFHLKQAAKADPENAQIRYNLAMMLASRGSLAAAKEELIVAERIQPGRIATHLALGEILERSTDTAAAAAEYEAALRLDRNDGLANLRMAKLLSASGKSDEAQPYYRVAAQSPDRKVRSEAIKGLK